MRDAACSSSRACGSFSGSVSYTHLDVYKRQAVIKSYDVVFAARPEFSDRTSYVIAPDGKILYVHSELNPADHVKNTLAAVQAWKAKHRR